MAFACVPPFDTICALTSLTLIAVAVTFALKAGHKAGDRGHKKPSSRFWMWAAVYMVFIVVLFAVLLWVGIQVDPVVPLHEVKK